MVAAEEAVALNSPSISPTSSPKTKENSHKSYFSGDSDEKDDHLEVPGDWLDDLDEEKNIKKLEHDQYSLTVAIQGINDLELYKKIEDRAKNLSILQKFIRIPVNDTINLEKRIERDIKVLRKLLYAYGFYDAEVKATQAKTLDQPLHKNSNQSKQLPSITLTAQVNQRYTIERINILGDRKMAHDLSTILHLITRLKRGDNMSSDRVLSARGKIEDYYKEKGFPFAVVEPPQAQLDYIQKKVLIFYHVTTGPLAIITSTHVKPLKNLDTSFIVNRIQWKNGDVYKQKQVDDTYKKLNQTGLLDSVDISAVPLEALNHDKANQSVILSDDKKVEKESFSTKKKDDPPASSIPVVMEVTAAKLPARLIGGGLRYASLEGIVGKIFWEHLNLSGHGQHLSINITGSRKRKKFEITYEIPDFIDPSQRLILGTFIQKEIARAYSGRSMGFNTRIQRELSETLKGSIGLAYEKSQLTRLDQFYNYSLIGIPLELIWDQANDLLNPTRGIRLNVKITPYSGQLSKNVNNIIIAIGKGSVYFPFYTNDFDEDLLCLAVFGRLGIVHIKSSDLIPPNKLFYSGGNGSIRGYGYQMVGPLSSSNTPLGGASVAEVGAEIRYQFNESWGGVCFLEGGSVNPGKVPTLKKRDAYLGTGFGIRYHTFIGPIRFDLGFPLKRRRNANGKVIDAPFQAYLTIGQAF